MPPGTRERLLHAAWRCLTDAGLAGATSRAITTAAGANLGAITYYFGSKDALLAEAIGAAIERLITPAVEALQDETVEPVARVLNAVNHLEAAYAGSARDAPAYLEVLLQSRRMPLVRERIVALLTRFRAVLAEQMAEQQGEGFLPAWVEPDAMAGLLLAVADGVVLQTSIDPDGPSYRAMAAQLAQLLIASRAQAG